MAPSQLRKLKPGTQVRWREGEKSPRAGELTDRGIVVFDTVRGGNYISWEDGQETDGRDDAALQQVEVTA